MSELTEAASDIIATLVAAGAGGTITVTAKTPGSLNLGTGQRGSNDTSVNVAAIKSSGDEVSLPTGGYTIEAGRIGYFAATADVGMDISEGDTITDGSDTYTISEVRHAMGGAILVMVCVDQEIV